MNYKTKEYKINFILPDFLANTRNAIIINIYKKYRFVFNEDTTIYSFYGTFPNAIWNGGRVDNRCPKFSSKHMKEVRDFYNKNGIRITLTFTNFHLVESHIRDEYCNQILNIFHNGMNEILVVSPVLEKYIRENYPKYKINKSITAMDVNGKVDTKKYDLSVIDKKYNHNYDFLKNIKEKNKIELLCDEICINNCPYTKQHYSEISEIQLYGQNINSTPFFGECRYTSKIQRYNHIAERNRKSTTLITLEDIYNVYVPMGFFYFKLSGREIFNTIGYESIINYLIKKEYQSDIRTYIYEKMLQEAHYYFLKLYKR